MTPDPVISPTNAQLEIRAIADIMREAQVKARLLASRIADQAHGLAAQANGTLALDHSLLPHGVVKALRELEAACNDATTQITQQLDMSAKALNKAA